jgi:hypothetical protein
MESVYDRLKDHIKEEIEKRTKEFPLTSNSLLKELKENTNFADVSYGAFFELQIIAKSLDWNISSCTHFIDFLKD